MRKYFFLTSLLFFSSHLNAKGIAHLTFHMAAGMEEKFKIGATVENKGDSNIYGGFLVLIPVDEKCTPLQPLLKNFGTLVPGEKANLESEVDSKISGYRVAGLYAYDEYGYALDTLDETKEILEKRKEKELQACASLNDRKRYVIIK